jgi:hypothetical protein
MIPPNFFIVGAPKCGTTSLAAWLAAHPAIYMPALKEPAHFAADLKPRRPDRRAYAALFAAADGRHRAVGEASTCYLFSQVAVPAILDQCAAPRFVVCLRNPIEMVRSLHQQLLFDLYEDVRPFEDAWRLQRARSEGERVPWTCPEPWLLAYESRCRLGEQVARLLRQVDRSQVLFVLLDDLQDAPGREYRRVLAFLGVDDDGRASFPVLNRAKDTRSRLVKLGVRFLSELRCAVGVTVRIGIRPVLDRLNTRPVTLAPMTNAVRDDLRACFAADVSLLGALVGRDLSHWTAPAMDVDGSRLVDLRGARGPRGIRI